MEPLRVLMTLLLFAVRATLAQRRCPLTIWVYENGADCEIERQGEKEPDAVGQLFADETCRETRIESSASDIAEKLLPGTYVLTCSDTEGFDNHADFSDSGCIFDDCRSTSSQPICDQAFDAASLYSRLPSPQSYLPISDPNGQFKNCIFMQSQEPNTISYAFVLFGDCTSCGKNNSNNDGTDETEEPAGTPPTQQQESTPSPTASPTAEPAVPETPPPTEAAAPPPTTEPPETEPPVVPPAPSPTQLPTEEEEQPTEEPPAEDEPPTGEEEPQDEEPTAEPTREEDPQEEEESPTEEPPDEDEEPTEEPPDEDEEPTEEPPRGEEEPPTEEEPAEDGPTVSSLRPSASPTAASSNNAASNTAPAPTESGNSNLGLIIGVVVGVLAVLVTFLVVGFLLGKKMQQKQDEVTSLNKISDDMSPVLIRSPNGTVKAVPYNGGTVPGMTGVYTNSTVTPTSLGENGIISFQEGNDDISTLEDPTVLTKDSVLGTRFVEDENTASVNPDYDYSKDHYRQQLQQQQRLSHLPSTDETEDNPTSMFTSRASLEAMGDTIAADDLSFGEAYQKDEEA